jgi:hypothetical protein
MKRCAFLLLLVVSAPATAQQPLAEFWQRLETASSLSELHSLNPAAAAEPQVAEGLLQLRRYEFSRDRSEALISRSKLERETQRNASAWAHFALGVSLARGPDLRVVVGDDPDAYFATPHSNAAKQAPRALKRALALDPTLHEAAFALAELALDLGDRDLLDDAQKALNEPARARMPRSLELRSQVLAQLGAVRPAAEAADRLRETGGDPALASYLKAVALLRQPTTYVEGVTAYFDGARALSDAAAVAYFDALRAVVSPAEAQRWARADLEAKADWLNRFWQVHAALAGVSVEQRVVEHYKRLAVVRRNGRVGPMGMALRRELDGRYLGVASFRDLLRLRHGDPVRDLRVRYCGKEVLQMPLALAPSPQQCAKSPISRMRENNATFVGASGVLERLAALEAAPGTSWYPPFRRHFEIVHELLQFRGSGGTTTLVASAGIPSAATHELLHDDVLTARIELALVDTARAEVLRADTLRRFRTQALPARGWVLLNTELELAPRASQLYRLVVMNEDRTAGRMVGGELTLRNYEGSDLMLSDVVLTPGDGTPSFVRGGVRLSLAPGRMFSTGESFTLYYEVYGLAEGDAYRTEIHVQPRSAGVVDYLRSVMPGRREAVRLAFQEEATSVHDVFGVQQSRTVGLDDLLPGSYSLRVTITDARGRTATRERTLQVVPRDE